MGWVVKAAHRLLYPREGPGTGGCISTVFSNIKAASVVYGLACWPLVPKFASSNPAEAVGFLRRKNPQHAFLRKESKAVGPMSQIYGM
jgi:hypothetical protein